MATHTFTIDELEIAQEMVKERYTLDVDSDSWDCRRGAEVESFDIDDAIFDPDLFDCFEVQGEDRERMKEEYMDDGIYADTLKEEFGVDINKFGDWSEIVVLNCSETHGGPQNCIEWSRICDGITCDQDDYDEFMENHEEFQTNEWKMEKFIAVMKEEAGQYVSKDLMNKFIDFVRENA